MAAAVAVTTAQTVAHPALPAIIVKNIVCAGEGRQSRTSEPLRDAPESDELGRAGWSDQVTSNMTTGMRRPCMHGHPSTYEYDAGSTGEPLYAVCDDDGASATNAATDAWQDNGALGTGLLIIAQHSPSPRSIGHATRCTSDVTRHSLHLGVRHIAGGACSGGSLASAPAGCTCPGRCDEPVLKASLSECSVGRRPALSRRW